MGFQNKPNFRPLKSSLVFMPVIELSLLKKLDPCFLELSLPLILNPHSQNSCIAAESRKVQIHTFLSLSSGE